MAGGVDYEVQFRDDIDKPFATLPPLVSQKNMACNLDRQIHSLHCIPCCTPHANTEDEIGLCSIPGERG